MIIDIRKGHKSEINGYSFDDSCDYVYMKHGTLYYSMPDMPEVKDFILVGMDEDFDNFIKACHAAKALHDEAEK